MVLCQRGFDRVAAVAVAPRDEIVDLRLCRRQKRKERIETLTRRSRKRRGLWTLRVDRGRGPLWSVTSRPTSLELCTVIRINNHIRRSQISRPSRVFRPFRTVLVVRQKRAGRNKRSTRDPGRGAVKVVDHCCVQWYYPVTAYDLPGPITITAVSYSALAVDPQNSIRSYEWCFLFYFVLLFLS